MKRKLSKQQEFEVFKLVVDKFLWLGLVIMGYGLYKMLEYTQISEGIYYILAGAIVLIILTVIIIREYEFITN